MSKRRQDHGQFAPRTDRDAALASHAGAEPDRRSAFSPASRSSSPTHGGRDNGKLPSRTRLSASSASIATPSRAGIREVSALGFIKQTRRGFAGSAEHHCPSLFELTYRPTVERSRPTSGNRSRPSKKLRRSPPRRARTNPNATGVSPGRRKRFRSGKTPEDPLRETRIGSRSGKPEI